MTIDGIHARLELSAQELRIAILTRKGFGRNAIAAALGLSPNSVKTILTRIRDKLGPRWRTDPRVWWPAEGEIACREGEVDTNPHPGARPEGYGAREAHAAALSLLIQQSRGQTVLKVSGAQRFWLQPALAALVERKHLRLLRVDWQDAYAPPWLPIVNRGRKEIRAATYVITNPRLVRSALEDYVKHDLPGFFAQVSNRLAEAGWHGSREENGGAAAAIAASLAEAFPQTTSVAATRTSGNMSA